MRKPDFEKVLTQDVKEAQPWFKNILEPLNRLFEYIKDAFNANIAVENLKIQIIKFSFIAPYATTSFKKDRAEKVAAVFVAQVTPAGNFPINWLEENGQITIFSTAVLTVGVQYTVTLFALY